MAKVILGLFSFRNEDDTPMVRVNHPGETIDVPNLYNYILNLNYPQLTGEIVTAWRNAGMNTKNVLDLGWAGKGDKRVSWITMALEGAQVTYISTDPHLVEFFNGLEWLRKQLLPQPLPPAKPILAYKVKIT